MGKSVNKFLKVIRKNKEHWSVLIKEGFGIKLHEEKMFETVDGYYFSENQIPNYFKENGLEVECIENTGGEDQGSEHHIVFKVTENKKETFYRLDGWYASYEGYDYDDVTDLYECVAVPVTKIEYHRKK